MDTRVSREEEFFLGTLNLSGWEHYGGGDAKPCDGAIVPGLHQDVYQRDIGGTLFSVGVFTYKGVPAFIAWGPKRARHCGMHAALASDTTVLDVRIGCPDTRPIRDARGVVTGFVLDGMYTFGSGSLMFSWHEWWIRAKRLGPLVLFLLLATLFATALNWPLSLHALQHDWMLDFMAGFFLLFGGLKIVNVHAFARAYAEYDIVARRFPSWGYIYAGAEVILGFLFLTRTALLFAGGLSVVLLSIATIGVHQKLKRGDSTLCACLGGFFNVPVTWLTFSENLAMILMGGMTVFHAL